MPLPDASGVRRLLQRLHARIDSASTASDAMAAHEARLKNPSGSDDDSHLFLDADVRWRPETDDHDAGFATFDEDLPPLPARFRHDALRVARRALQAEIDAMQARLAFGQEIRACLCPFCGAEAVDLDAHVCPEPMLGLIEVVMVYDKGHFCGDCGAEIRRHPSTLGTLIRSSHALIVEREEIRAFLDVAAAGLAELDAIEARLAVSATTEIRTAAD